MTLSNYMLNEKNKRAEFSPDSFLQHELEASFIYEDTPDFKSHKWCKKRHGKYYPMDRLICGDVGFEKLRWLFVLLLLFLTINK